MSNLPDKSSSVDQQLVQISGPDGLKTNWQYNAETNTWIGQMGPVVIPKSHGSTHIEEDQVPEATVYQRGLMSADQAAKLAALTQMRIGVSGFIGDGFPDDGGWLDGEVILAAGNEGIVLEKVGNIVRFTVNNPLPITCGLEECAKIFWIQDETDSNQIRPPTCAGKLLGATVPGELKVHLFPENIIVDSSDPTVVLNTKNNYPMFSFRRYSNGITPNLGRIDVVLERNTNTTAKTGWSMTPGSSTAVAENVWFMGHDDGGNQIRFEMVPETDEELLGALMYKGHTLTRRMAVIVDYTTTTTSTNQYTCRFWNVDGAKPIGESFVATNVWQYNNPENSSDDLTFPKSLVKDVTADVLPVGTLVQIWEFQIQEVNNNRIVRRYFNTKPRLNPDHLWSHSGLIRFGHLLGAREEVDPGPGETDATAFVDEVEDIRLHERSEWGITGFEDPLLLMDDLVSTDAVLFSGSMSAIGVENAALPSPNVEITVTATLAVNTYSDDVAEFPTLTDLTGQQYVVLQNSTNTITIGGIGPLELQEAVTTAGGLPQTILITSQTASPNPSAVPINNRFVANIDPSRPALIVENIDPDEDRELPVFVWHRSNHKNVYLHAKVGLPAESDFPPIDVVLRAPVDSFDDTFMQVISRGEIASGPLATRPFIRVTGVDFNDMPARGTLRILTGVYRDTIWNYDYKIPFGGTAAGTSLVLVGRPNETFLFEEDFVPGDTDSNPSAFPDSTTPATTTVVQLLRHDYSAPCLRIEFSVINNTGDESVQVQFKGGTLDMSMPYELDQSNPKDNYVRGMRDGYTISRIYTQDGFISTGLETPDAEPSGFLVYDGGTIPAAINGVSELWNDLEIIYRDDQMWVWWNGLLVTPDTTASAALPSPVAVSSAYFPVTSDFETGKVGLRLWPGAVVREITVRDQVAFANEFMYGQVDLSTGTGTA